MITFCASCDCGWSRTHSSQAKADYGLRAHSCAKQLRLAAAAERGRARRANVDRTPKPCQHKHAQHVHGTHATYVLDACRCLPCSSANSAYEKRRARLHAYGRFNDWTAAAPVRTHIEQLLAAGVGLKRIAAVSGCSHGTLSKLVYGSRGRPPSRRVHVRTAGRVLAVTAEQHAPGARVPAMGSTRRVQALIAIGYSASAIAARLGVHRSNFTYVLYGRRDVTLRTRGVIAALYAELEHTPAVGTDPGTRCSITAARSMATRNGWPVPAAWDDIDDPAEAPHADAAGAEGCYQVPSTELECFAEDVEWLADSGLTVTEITGRLKVTEAAAERRLRRVGRSDLWRRIRDRRSPELSVA